MNWFVYCANNPLRYIDLDGREINKDTETFFYYCIENGIELYFTILGAEIGGTAGGAAGLIVGPGGAVVGATSGAMAGAACGYAVGQAVGKATVVVIKGAVDWVYSTTNKPIQDHHIATNKSKKYTPEINKISNKYGLDLNDDWNRVYMPHQGKHPNAYHDFVVESMKDFDKLAQGNKDKFLELFGELKQYISAHPEMLTKNFWR